MLGDLEMAETQNQQEIAKQPTKDELLEKWDSSWKVYIWYGSIPDFLLKWGLLENHAMREHMEYHYIDTDQDETYEVMFTTKNVEFNTDDELLSKLKQLR